MPRNPARRTVPEASIQKAPEVQLPPAEPEVALPQQAVYKFWNKAKCPRCGGMDTEAYATHGPVQSRVCRSPICRWRWKVTGEMV